MARWLLGLLACCPDQVNHICRIARITDNPCGNALLVGVGGSPLQEGKLACMRTDQHLHIVVSWTVFLLAQAICCETERLSSQPQHVPELSQESAKEPQCLALWPALYHACYNRFREAILGSCGHLCQQPGQRTFSAE